MNRRDLLALLGATALSSLTTPLSAEQRLELGEVIHRRLAGGGQAGQALDPAQMALVGAVADTIIPPTDTPGATDVGVPAFVDLLLAEWYTPEERDGFVTGLDALAARCRETMGGEFPGLDGPDRERFVATLDGATGQPGSAEGTYARLKSLTVYGYFTSREVQTRVLRTPMLPGRFEGCVPLPVR